MDVSVGFCSTFFFFFKQKTAYEMRISDWSSDVCSSDLYQQFQRNRGNCERAQLRRGGLRRPVGRRLVVLFELRHRPDLPLTIRPLGWADRSRSVAPQLLLDRQNDQPVSGRRIVLHAPDRSGPFLFRRSVEKSPDGLAFIRQEE